MAVPVEAAYDDAEIQTVFAAKVGGRMLHVCVIGSLNMDLVAAGGVIANVGVHGKSVELHLERLWAHNITLTTRLVDTVTTPLLLKTVISGRLQPKQLVTHHFKLSEVMHACDTFANAAKGKGA